MPTTAYIVTADGSLDQICETKDQANMVKKSLMQMGCRVKVLTCPWKDQDKAIEDFNL